MQRFGLNQNSSHFFSFGAVVTIQPSSHAEKCWSSLAEINWQTHRQTALKFNDNTELQKFEIRYNQKVVRFSFRWRNEETAGGSKAKGFFLPPQFPLAYKKSYLVCFLFEAMHFLMTAESCQYRVLSREHHCHWEAKYSKSEGLFLQEPCHVHLRNVKATGSSNAKRFFLPPQIPLAYKRSYLVRFFFEAVHYLRAAESCQYKVLSREHQRHWKAKYSESLDLLLQAP